MGADRVSGVRSGAKETHAGRCNCGAVSYVAVGTLRPAVACHCKSCRRQSSHFLVATQVPRDMLTVRGEENLRWFHTTAKARRGFCETCGVHLFWEELGKDRISILAGSLDEPTGLHIGQHIFLAEKGDYYEILS